MSFSSNSVQQLSLFDQIGFLSERKQHLLDKSWAKTFSDQIFSHIDEHIFMPLYSEKRNSRPNAPINVIVGALIIKELNGMTDDEVMESCEFDFRYQYALHTTSFEDQPISDRTFSRFRARCAAYELTTGTDLIHDCITSIAEDIRGFINISPDIKRMDSMMIESNIRYMGRLELLYTCLSNLVKLIDKSGDAVLIKGLEHYADPNDRNKVIYHDDTIPKAERVQTVIDDASSLLPKCKEQYGQTDDYQLLLRAVEEQTKDDGNGRILKGKDDRMDSRTLQNPSDPDATYRIKAGKQHRGYSANLTETVDEKGSVVTEYQYDQNIHSDVSFLSEALDGMEPSTDTSVIIADGAYDSTEISVKAADKNIAVLTTGLSGRTPNKISSRFALSDDETSVVSCPNGNAPKASSYIKQNGQIRASFELEQCENCPYLKECRPQLKQRTAFKLISVKAVQRLKERQSDIETWKLIGRIRNGVETVPSIIRNKFGVDRMPIRGKLRTKQFFGFKIGALNFIKLFRYIKGKERCRAFT